MRLHEAAASDGPCATFFKMLVIKSSSISVNWVPFISETQFSFTLYNQIKHIEVSEQTKEELNSFVDCSWEVLRISNVILALTAFLLVASTGCDLFRKSQPLTPDELRKYQSCLGDDECVYAQNGPCDCNNGGESIAVNRSNLREFKALFKSIPCTKRGGSRCEDGIVKCENNICVLEKVAPDARRF